jgi:signal transduction histidine kinase
VGKPFCESGIPWNNKDVVKQILSCRNSKQPTRIDDVRFKRPDGKVGFLGITVNSVNDTGENQTTLLIIGSDITHRQTIESQLVQAQKLESIGQLAAGIAHEINTPTQYVGDNTRFLQDAFGEFNKLYGKYKKLLEACRNGSAPVNMFEEIDRAEKEVDVEYLIEEIPKAIQQSLEGTERIGKIVRAMKEFSHPGTDEKTPIDINKAIESTITVSRNEWKYVAEMITVFDTSLPLVPCLPGEFNQAILNIIINAAHAIGDLVGDGTGRMGVITVTTSRSGNYAEVRIHDTGTGIPEEIRSKIFDPFFTTKPVGKGTGQGLSIVHSIIVEKHKGTVSFETEVGKGTTFIIRIPLEND